MLKFWVSAMAAERWVRTCLGSVPDRAERARRFCTSVLAEGLGVGYRQRGGYIKRGTFGSCKSSFSHCSAVLMERVGSHAVEGKSLIESGVGGVSISLLT